MDKLKEFLQEYTAEALEESRREMEMRMIQIEEIGWKRLYGEVDSEEGFSLDSLKSVSEDLYDMVATSPLISRAIELRHGYTFGKGFQLNIPDHAKMVKNVMDNPYNWESTLADEATERLLIEDAAAGNAFHIKKGRGKDTKIISVPLSQVTGIITDEDDAQRIHYFQRSWSVKGKERTEWIPLNRYVESGAKIPDIIRALPSDPPVTVSKDTVGFVFSGMRPAGWTFGIPTALAAKAWLVMYTEALQNNAILVKALSQIAWKYTNKTGKGARAVGAEIASEKGVGGSISMSDTQDVQAMPRGNDVNFNNVQPLAALVASRFGVSVIALLASPGATGGSYGAATTLDEPTLNVMSTLRKKMKRYIEEILNSISPTVKVEIEFPSMSGDADYRKAQALANAHATGALFQREYRDAILQLYPIENPQKGLPKPNGFNTWADWKDEAPAPGGMAAQGKSGPVPGGTNQGETDHSTDNGG